MTATEWIEEFLREGMGYAFLVDEMRGQKKSDEEIKDFLESFA